MSSVFNGLLSIAIFIMLYAVNGPLRQSLQSDPAGFAFACGICQDIIKVQSSAGGTGDGTCTCVLSSGIDASCIGDVQAILNDKYNLVGSIWLAIEVRAGARRAREGRARPGRLTALAGRCRR